MLLDVFEAGASKGEGGGEEEDGEVDNDAGVAGSENRKSIGSIQLDKDRSDLHPSSAELDAESTFKRDPSINEDISELSADDVELDGEEARLE
jgi:hypothetical protein